MSERASQLASESVCWIGMAQVHPKSSSTTNKSSSSTASSSAQDVESGQVHVQTTIDAPAQELHRYRPDFFGDYMYECRCHLLFLSSSSWPLASRRGFLIASSQSARDDLLLFATPCMHAPVPVPDALFRTLYLRIHGVDVLCLLCPWLGVGM